MMNIGVLLVNLGTPLSPQRRDVFSYLNEFLTDDRVLDFPWLKRQALARGVIVPFRTNQSAKLYQSIWTKEGSPLLKHSQEMQRQLQHLLGEQFQVFLAMRYQKPSIPEVLNSIKREQLDKLIILPLFPQYASATTGSIFEKIMHTIQAWPVFPSLAFVSSFYNHPKFIESICSRAKQYEISRYDHVLFSFHGLPERQIAKACRKVKSLSSECCRHICLENRHCYKAQCMGTAHAIAKQLSLQQKNYSICFQSRLGKEPWIQPYTSDILRRCVQKGFKTVLAFSPSFVCDCLETISEIGEEYALEFRRLGGEKLQLVEGLNSHPDWIKALEAIVRENV